jgi:hypothetical protein
VISAEDNMRTFVDRSMRGWLLLAALAASNGAGAAQSAAGAPAIEFHVKPGGVQPFTSSDPSVRPQLGRPGRPEWATGGIEPGFWLSGGGSAERPFATLFQAQLAVRELLRTKGMPEGGIRVVVHGGVYRLAQPLEFVPNDSGTPEKPVVYTAAPGEKPAFSGGVPIAGWRKLQKAVAGLPPAAAGHV